MKSSLARVIALLGGILACGGALAAFPDRPMRLVVGVPSGDTSDLIARVVAPTLREFLGQPFVIENTPGGTGNVASARVAKSRPDGYTLLLATPTLATSASLHPNLPQQPLRDFVPISRIAIVHLVLAVHAGVPAHTLAGFVAAIRESPGSTSIASAGAGSISHLAAELLKMRAGPLNTLHVPYKGIGPALTDVAGGHVDALFATMPYAYPHVKSGRIRALAVASARRAAALGDVPTFTESGIAGVEAVAWNALMAPGGTPYDTVVRLQLAVAHAAASAPTRSRLAALGAESASDNGDQFAEYLRAEVAKWAGVIKSAGVVLE